MPAFLTQAARACIRAGRGTLAAALSAGLNWAQAESCNRQEHPMQSVAFVFCGLLAFGQDVPAAKPGAAKVETVTVNLDLKPADARYQLPAPSPQLVKLSEQPGASAKSPPAKKGLLFGEIPFGPTSQPSGVAIMVDESNPPAATLRVD